MRKVASIFLAALLASCARGAVSPVPSTLENGEATQWEMPLGTGYKLLYAFKSGNDAGFPYAGLTVVNGELYGTTYGGGGGVEWGTVFKIDTSGNEHVLYRFKAGNDGAHPYGGLTALGGELYGTTYQGGTSGSGTVFKVTTSGDEHVLYSFKGGSDGQYPYGALLDVNGEFYGTTYQGGVSPGWGVVFKVSPTGDEHVLYRFKAGDDGAHPYAGLTNVSGTLYGTTYQGGTSGAGTVFKTDTAGSEHVAYSFKAGRDGQYPYAPLLYYKGKLYGTTYQGGVSPGWGTVYEVTPAGQERVLYRFKAGTDGAHPQYGALVDVNGAFYGTTYQGGTKGAGTVFKVAASGTEEVLYSFMGGNDGEYPYDGLANVNGTFYGTTNVGGADDAGTVFKISP
jgi:uncharacterized repeat protein (TIGR03803 family)